MSKYDENKQIEVLEINRLFTNTSYIVPIYQRNYAWENKQIEELLNDISDAEAQNYYLGNLIVKRRADAKKYFEVVDGQQRLTTLFLLITVLNKVIKDDPIPLELGALSFETREKSNSTFLELYKNDYPFELPEFLSKEIYNGFDCICKFFKIQKIPNDKECDYERIKKFKEKLCKKVKLLRVQVPENTDMNHYFEIMNTRGEQLEEHEIIKGQLLGVLNANKNKEVYRKLFLDLTQEDKEKLLSEDNNEEQLLENYKQAETYVASMIWDACADMFYYVQMGFEKKYREIIFGPDWNTFVLKRFENIVFNIVNYDILNTKTKSFDLVQQNTDAPKDEFIHATIPDIIDNGLGKQLKEQTIKRIANDDSERRRFESIISFSDFLLQVNCIGVTAANENNLDDNKFFELLKNNLSNVENAKNFLFNILKFRFLFDKYIIKREYIKQYIHDGKWSLQQLINKDGKPNYFATYQSKDYNEDGSDTNQKLRMLQSGLRITYTSPKSMEWIHKVLLKIDEDDKTDLITYLENYCSEKVQQSGYEDAKGFNVARIIFSYLDYLLFVEYIYNNDKTFFSEDTSFKPEKDWQFQFRNSIEHFHPQKSDNNDDWDWETLNSFGNLALLTAKDNSKFSNAPPIAKAEEYKDIILQSPKLMIMGNMIVESGWTKDNVEKHRKEMIKFLSDHL